MARERYIVDRHTGELIPINEYAAIKAARGEAGSGIQIVKDIEPFKSVVDGSIIGSRRDKREHMKVHGLIEVGNERIGRARNSIDMPDVRRDLADSFQGRRD